MVPKFATACQTFSAAPRCKLIFKAHLTAQRRLKPRSSVSIAVRLCACDEVCLEDMTHDASLRALTALQRVNVNSTDLLCKCPGKRCTLNSSGALWKREAPSYVIPFIRLPKVVVIAARPQTRSQGAAVVQSGCDVTPLSSPVLR